MNEIDKPKYDTFKADWNLDFFPFKYIKKEESVAIFH
jgi:hypothetical protein